MTSIQAIQPALSTATPLVSQATPQPSQLPQSTIFSTAPPSSASTRGICSVCVALYKLFGAPLVLRRHGHGNGKPACPGTGQPPRPGGHHVGSTTQLAEQPGDPLVDSASNSGSRDFSLLVPSGPVLPRIPKGARLRAATELGRRLSAVVSSPDDLGAWSSLLGFGSLLTQPARGGVCVEISLLSF